MLLLNIFKAYSTTTGVLKKPIFVCFQKLFELRCSQGDGRDLRSRQGLEEQEGAAEVGRHGDPLLPRHLRAGQPHEGRQLGLILQIP